MSRPSQRTQKPKKTKEKHQQEDNTNRNTPTVTQLPLTKYVTHKESPFTQIGQKDSKKRKKNSGEILPDKRHHESKENMSINPENNDQMITQVNTQNNQLQDGKNPKHQLILRLLLILGTYKTN